MPGRLASLGSQHETCRCGLPAPRQQVTQICLPVCTPRGGHRIIAACAWRGSMHHMHEPPSLVAFTASIQTGCCGRRPFGFGAGHSSSVVVCAFALQGWWQAVSRTTFVRLYAWRVAAWRCTHGVWPHKRGPCVQDECHMQCHFHACPASGVGQSQGFERQL